MLKKILNILEKENPFILILVGVPLSGKSSTSKEIVKKL